MNSPSVQTMLGAAGSCPEILHNGKTWKIGHPTQRAKAALEELVIRKAAVEILGLKSVLPPDQYAEMFESFRAAVSSGEYKTGGPSWARTAFTGQGAPLFFLALLRENHPEATEKDVRELSLAEPDQCILALSRVVPDFFDLLLSELPLPPESKEKVRVALEAVKAILLPRAQPSPSTPTSAA